MVSFLLLRRPRQSIIPTEVGRQATPRSNGKVSYSSTVSILCYRSYPQQVL
jgi:hypothetical protein